ncbi:hypothetical protein [Pseudenterobacter timonensis]|uniref:hypothetical protein n=1 Tax=Pseudenterobacter timonensis TaxID=1755099 RepID=UPI002877FE5B|nr:hypothetical protein [Pseudenterobacter timonensis]
MGRRRGALPSFGAINFRGNRQVSSALFFLSLIYAAFAARWRFACFGTLVAKVNHKNLLFHANVTGDYHEEIAYRTGRGRMSVN